MPSNREEIITRSIHLHRIIEHLGANEAITKVLADGVHTFTAWCDAVKAEYERTHKTHNVVQVTRKATKKGDPMWECLTDEGVKFYLFSPFGIAELDAYTELKTMLIGEVLYWDNTPIRLTLIESGGWLKANECEPRPAGSAPNERTLLFNVQWVRELYKRPFVVVDFETTGTQADAEIIQIGIAFSSRQFPPMRINVRPQNPVPEDATRVHGIKTADFQGEKSFAEVLPQLQNIFSGMQIVAYNAEFEQARLAFELKRINAVDAIDTGRIQCAMKAYAYGRPFFKLIDACRAMGVEVTEAHDAMADAKATLALLDAMKQAIVLEDEVRS